MEALEGERLLLEQQPVLPMVEPEGLFPPMAILMFKVLLADMPGVPAVLLLHQERVDLAGWAREVATVKPKPQMPMELPEDLGLVDREEFPLLELYALAAQVEMD